MSDRLTKLEDLVEFLRGPTGCPWDREQRLPQLRAYVLEEAHELAAAIDGEDRIEIREELGDLLFQLVFVCHLLGKPNDRSELSEAINGVHRKMIDRHPHVFGGEPLADSSAVSRAWEGRKADRGGSTLAGLPNTLPALLAAFRVSQKAAGVGFDWPDTTSVLNKVEEELSEIKSALAGSVNPERVEEELGDLLFAAANLARKLGFDPESALQKANRKFQERFAMMENTLEGGGRLSELTGDELDELWRYAKHKVPGPRRPR